MAKPVKLMLRQFAGDKSVDKMKKNSSRLSPAIRQFAAG
jgi:hypothetical protein